MINKISPNIMLLYCMLINKGRVCIDAVGPRGKLPFTITEDCADRIIRKICDDIAKDAGVDPKDINVKVTNYDFCHCRNLKKRLGATKIYNRIKPNIGKFGATFKRVS